MTRHATFAELLAKSAIRLSLERLGGNWKEVYRTLREDFEIDFSQWGPGEFQADDNPLALWAQRLFPRLCLCADETGLIGYMPDGGDEIAIDYPMPVAVFVSKWVNREIG